ncbi:MAG: DNA (cytosine-5-)-methyltransferase [Campylobacterota bacterium]|nr:DNA (cytosine-5-)-methyltransferase [Campylobacterota bacterium]
MERLKALSLFSGCGGMDLGLQGGFKYLDNDFKKHSIDILLGIDNDPYAAKIYNENFSHECVVKDIKDLNHNELPEHDILLGGFPCQSFSISAQNPPRLGIKDERGELFFEMCKILKEKQPRFFVAENVKGILSANKKEAFPLIIKEFEQSGYHIKFQLLNSSDFGIPQKRERVFIVGFKSEEDYFRFSFPKPITTDEKVPLKSVLQDNITEKYFFSERAVAGMKRVQHKMNKGRAQNINLPCNTISAHLAKVSLNSTDPVLLENGKYRRFTPREAANIQSFPSDFQLEVVSENRQYRAIGNAVPPVVMWHIGNSLMQIVE